MNTDHLEIRNELLSEALSSPQLLSDLAGLEEYVAESYDSRSIVELLQNADDAQATRFHITRVGPLLVIANDGRLFSVNDFRSLCRSAASNKNREVSIGFRGIGFKSVASFAKEVFLSSGDLQCVFSRDLTKDAVPGAFNVPLVRIPHPLRSHEHADFIEAAQVLHRSGYRTVFGFLESTENSVSTELEVLDPTSLLFLRHIQQFNSDGFDRSIRMMVHRRKEASGEVISLSVNDETQEWRTFVSEGVTLAVPWKEGRPVAADAQSALVHAFLPTRDSTGFPMKVHGDLSTDPSRTRVVLDERTQRFMTIAGEAIVNIYARALAEDRDATSLFPALVPLTAPQVTLLQRKSFATELLNSIRGAASATFQSWRIAPSWLNARDSAKLLKESPLHLVREDIVAHEGAVDLLKFLGAKDVTLDDLLPRLEAAEVTHTGAVQLVAHFATQASLGLLNISATPLPKSKLWLSESGALASTDTLLSLGQRLDSRFITEVQESSATPGDLKRLLLQLVGDSHTKHLLGNHNTESASQTLDQSAAQGKSEPANYDEYHPEKPESRDPQQPFRLNLESAQTIRWRSAEQLLAHHFKNVGWSSADVSRQNLGYDLELTDPDGTSWYVEVKSVEHFKQPFILTSNEESTARLRSPNYVIALVRQGHQTGPEVRFIRSPIEQLELSRQCRQWVWECTNYSEALETRFWQNT